MNRPLAILLSMIFFAAPAHAHEGHGSESCHPGEVCGQVAVLGSWGLIVLGLLFWLLALWPYRPPGEVEDRRGLALPRIFRALAGKESTGWRRMRWPVLGLMCVALGVASLVGWR